jgi:hypothetical protein
MSKKIKRADCPEASQCATDAGSCPRAHGMAPAKRCLSFTPLQPLQKPLSLDELKLIADKTGRINVNVSVPLAKLIGCDQGIDDLNELADELILEEGSLSDISYMVVGGSQSKEDKTVGGDVLINVSADVSDILSESL